MYCEKCGNKIQEGDDFCPNCGNRIFIGMENVVEKETVIVGSLENGEINASDASAPANSIHDVGIYTENASFQNAKNKRSWVKTIVLVVIVVVLLAGAGLGGYFWYNSPKQSLFRALKGADYDEARDIVEENEKLAHNADVADRIRNKIISIRDEFYKEEKDYSVVKNELYSIRDIGVAGIEAEVYSANEYIDKLNSSRVSYGIAEEFMEKGEYPAAINQYQGVIEDDPNYQKARNRMVEATEKYRDIQLNNAQTRADQGNYQGAIDIIAMALDVLPNDTKLSQQMVMYQSDLARQKKNEIIDSAEELAKKRQYISAMGVLDQYIDLNPTDAEVKEIRQKYYDTYVNEVLAQTDSRVNAGDYTGAINELNNGLAFSPDEKRFVDKKTEVNDQHIQKILGDAQAKVSGGEYARAITILEDGLRQYNNDVRITEKINEYKDLHIRNIIAEVEKLEGERDYISAIDVMREGIAQYSGEQRLLDKKTEIEEEYVKSIVAQGDKLLKEKGYAEAQDVVKEALVVLPSNQLLLNKMAEYNQYQPVDLFALDYFNACYADYEVYGPYEGKDNEGNTRWNSYSLSHYDSSNAWVVYKLDGNYDFLKGTFYLDYEYRTTDKEMAFYVYGDDKLLYKGTITGGEVPKDFSIQITGVKMLKISCHTDLWTGAWSMPRFAGKFSETYIMKTP